MNYPGIFPWGCQASYRRWLVENRFLTAGAGYDEDCLVTSGSPSPATRNICRRLIVNDSDSMMLYEVVCPSLNPHFSLAPKSIHLVFSKAPPRSKFTIGGAIHLKLRT